MEQSRSGKANRLSKEKSPYLQQHAWNPVDWYPWCDEAFEKAAQEDKPLFLSIGYSTCHWCHVMEHESFSNPEVASLLNNAFVCVKVDREERPDLDDVYMQVCQVITGSGGWPLSVLLTPDKKPFFAATYIPRETRGDIIGLVDLIPRIDDLWRSKKNEVRRSSEQFALSLHTMSYTPSPGQVDQSVVKGAYEELADQFDKRHGGFGSAPKFPSPQILLFLLKYWNRSDDPDILGMISKTLTSMAHGGIFDQAGSGFHRYSTDSEWLIPHFEKMLYDQAMHLRAYTETYLATHNVEFGVTAGRTADYVLNEMTSPEGAFYSAEDADSDNEEGGYYFWTKEQIQDALADNLQFDIACKLYNINDMGNIHNGKGRNILYLIKSENEYAEEFGYDPLNFHTIVESIRTKLDVHRRLNRQRPFKDEKILTDWNGMMIASLARAGRVFERERFVTAAVNAAQFIFDKMRMPDGGLYHRYCDNEAAVNGFSDDYAFMVWGLIELYEATFDEQYLAKAIECNTYLVTHFWDTTRGGFFGTADYSETLLLRRKESYDGAYPSGNSVAFVNQLVLATATGQSEYFDRANAILKAFSGDISNAPSMFTYMLSGMEYLQGRSHEVIIAGDPKSEDTQKMVRAINTHFVPDTLILIKPLEPEKPGIIEIAHFLENYSSIDKKATAYVCTDHTCKAPTTDVSKMMEFLNEER